jgi:hypothetical protein
MRVILILLSLLTFSPNPGSCQPQTRTTRADEPKCRITASAYCLKGHTSQGPRTTEIPKCIALSRDLIVTLGLLKNNQKKFRMKGCQFGAIVVIEGLGEFTFADVMPPRWKRRVDIWQPTRKHCEVFGIKKGCKIWVKQKNPGEPVNGPIDSAVLAQEMAAD